MTSGLPWHELNSVEQDYSAWVSSPDPLRWILDKPLDHEPGSFWHYNTGASHIASAILTEATGQSARAFAQDQLFGPLDSVVGNWPADPRGYNYGGHGISLQARTLVRFGTAPPRRRRLPRAAGRAGELGPGGDGDSLVDQQRHALGIGIRLLLLDRP